MQTGTAGAVADPRGPNAEPIQTIPRPITSPRLIPLNPPGSGGAQQGLSVVGVQGGVPLGVHSRLRLPWEEEVISPGGDDVCRLVCPTVYKALRQSDRWGSVCQISVSMSAPRSSDRWGSVCQISVSAHVPTTLFTQPKLCISLEAYTVERLAASRSPRYRVWGFSVVLPFSHFFF